jgi:hypothetical protein
MINALIAVRPPLALPGALFRAHLDILITKPKNNLNSCGVARGNWPDDRPAT